MIHLNDKENDLAENRRSNARTQFFIDSQKEADIEIAESIHKLIIQTAFYRGVSLTAAKKIVGEILKGGPK